ncbi:intraflagellar transport protein 74 homolog [Agrilus planipennis]|uniref:Intraflagellar transport protein 74 homolog n=1 Tax=Agrilus planipennis TaxID=224129 RepID=A0A1W4WJQ2_AGRPL|nr:intraflagellar transport protein 74 homolog [Agrilus planipennis]
MQRKASARPSTGRPLSGLPTMARPITQQGLSGPRRLGTAQGSNRIHKDQRYYISQIQSHIGLLQDEIIRLKKSIVEGKVASVTKPELKRIAEKLARKFAEQQELLNTYNNALDFHMSYITNDKIAQDTAKTRERNRQLMDELENVQIYKLKREENLKQLKKEFDEEEQFTKKIIETLSTDEREKYLELYEQNKKYVEKINEQQKSLKNVKEKIENDQKMLIPSKQKQTKLTLLKNYERAKRQHETLSKQVNEIINPENQKEILLQQVKKDKADIEVLSKTKTLLDEELKEKQGRLQIMEEELDNTNNKRLEKHKELRQREVVMNEFIDTFEEKRSRVMKNIQKEQDKIIESLDAMLISIADFEINDMNANTDFRKMPLEELKKHYEVLSARIARLNMINEKDDNEIKQLTQEKEKTETNLDDLNDIDKKKATIESELKNVKQEIANIKNKLNATVSAVSEAEKKKSSLEEQLSKSQEYKKIVKIEQRIENIEKELNELQNEIEGDESETIVKNRLDEVSNLIEKYNEELKKRLKKKINLVQNKFWSSN